MVAPRFINTMPYEPDVAYEKSKENRWAHSNRRRRLVAGRMLTHPKPAFIVASTIVSIPSTV